MPVGEHDFCLPQASFGIPDKYVAMRYSTRKLKPPPAVKRKGRIRKKISSWEILYADPNVKTTPEVTLSR